MDRDRIVKAITHLCNEVAKRTPELFGVEVGVVMIFAPYDRKQADGELVSNLSPEDTRKVILTVGERLSGVREGSRIITVQ